MLTNLCGKKSKRGYAVAEMMVFGVVLVLVMGVLVSYIQQINDQQYVKQEAFRRALVKANPRQGAYSEGPGASVQYYRLENRRHLDLDSQEYARGVTDGFTSDANVFWAIPTEPAYLRQDSDVESDVINPEDKHFVSVNDQEEEGELEREFYISSYDEADYQEASSKDEAPGAIVNQHSADQSEHIENIFPGWDGRRQEAYLTPEGQVRYSDRAPQRDYGKDMIWVTPD